MIDTPGFDDSGLSDYDILQIISEYLRAAYTEKIFLTGIIYVQKITDNRMQGSAVRCLRLLKKLCGPDYYGNIVLVTTMWDDIKPEEGERRENQLRTTHDYWGQLIKQGATFQRHLPRGKDSALRIVKHLLEKTPTVLKFQRELHDEHGVIANTSAGQVLMIFYSKKLAESEKKIKQMRKDLEDSQAVVNKVKEELEKLRNEREAREEERKKESEISEEERKKEREVQEEERQKREALVEEMRKDKEVLTAEISRLTKEVEFNAERVRRLNEVIEEKARPWPNCRVQ